MHILLYIHIKYYLSWLGGRALDFQLAGRESLYEFQKLLGPEVEALRPLLQVLDPGPWASLT